MQAVTTVVERYQDWVRHNSALASNVELIVRAVTFLNMDPQSLFAVEAAYSSANIIGLIHQAAADPNTSSSSAAAAAAAATAVSSVVAQEYTKRQATLKLLLRLIRESQCVGELLLRKMILLPGLKKNAAAVAAGSGSATAAASSYLLAVQLYITGVECAKIVIKYELFRDVWRSVGWQMIQFFGRPTRSTEVASVKSSSSSSSGGGGGVGASRSTTASAGVFATLGLMLTTLMQELGLVERSRSTSVTVPHVISTASSSSCGPKKDGDSPPAPIISRADRAALWLDLADMIKPLVMSLALCRVWHRRRSLHSAWMIWVAGVVYEVVAAVAQWLLHRHRSAFLRSDGSLVQGLNEAASGRGRSFALGCHLLKYPFFNTILEPELRVRLLSESCFLAKLPLVGGYAQGWISYMMEVQKRCVLFSAGS